MRQAYDYWQDQPGISGAAERVCGRTRYYLTTHLQRQSLSTNNDNYQTFRCLHTRESEPAVVRCTFDCTRRCDTVDPDRAKLSHTGKPETIANCECVVCRMKRHKLYPVGNQRADHRTGHIEASDFERHIDTVLYRPTKVHRAGLRSLW